MKMRGIIAITLTLCLILSSASGLLRGNRGFESI